MVKHNCLSVFDHFVKLAFKGLSLFEWSAIYLLICKKVQLIVFIINVDFDIFWQVCRY